MLWDFVTNTEEKKKYSASRHNTKQAKVLQEKKKVISQGTIKPFIVLPKLQEK